MTSTATRSECSNRRHPSRAPVVHSTNHRPGPVCGIRDTDAYISVLQRIIVQFSQGIQAFTQHGLVRPIAGVGPVQQNTCPVSLTRVASPTTRRSLRLLLAWPAAPVPTVWWWRYACQSWSCRTPARTSVDKLGSAVMTERAISICAFSSCCIRDLGGQAVKRLPGELGGWQTRHARHTRFQEGSEMAFACRHTEARCTRHGEHPSHQP